MVGVNVSAAQLHNLALIDDVAAALDAAALEPHLLCLELTETTVMHDPDLAATVLTALSRRGVRIAIDDFGTGYSALAQLRRLPLDIVKVDKSFIDTLDHDEQTSDVTNGVMHLLDGLGVVSVAEGIERPEQLAALRETPCRVAQGFLFSKPVPAAAFATLAAIP